MQPRSSPALPERHERGGGARERGMADVRGGAQPELRADRRTRDREQHAAEIRVGHERVTWLRSAGSGSVNANDA